MRVFCLGEFVRIATHRHVFDPPSTIAQAIEAIDAQIAAVCREHGVERLLTEDRDFSRFTFLDVVTLAEEPAA